jgi:hypothetical protein
MAENTGKAVVEITGHNRESSGRVVHYLRPVSGAGEGSIEFHGGTIITDDKNVIADGKQFELTIKYTPVK